MNNVKKLDKSQKPPAALANLSFFDERGWLLAWQKYSPELVVAAVFKSFRQRHLLSIEGAASRCGVSPKSWWCWENAQAKIQFKTRLDFIENEWFQPFHFGINKNEGSFAA